MLLYCVTAASDLTFFFFLSLVLVGTPEGEGSPVSNASYKENIQVHSTSESLVTYWGFFTFKPHEGWGLCTCVA